jgi:alpha-glucosidase (family GH31 glycosyl hydrolase)
MVYTKQFGIPFRPLARPKAVVRGPFVRFTVLTSRLLRLEYSPDDSFEDRPSQTFWFRDQPVPYFEVRRNAHTIEIETEHLSLMYVTTNSEFTPDSLFITLKENGRIWRIGDSDHGNLGGTARTLDSADGALDPEAGLLSRDGWVLVDDSATLVFDPDGWLQPRDPHPASRDLYFFGYGLDYSSCLRDFAKVAGPVPLIPRWALGNWWSRYWRYSADELLTLMNDFRRNVIPLSVCIVDMDWHITETGNDSTGWSGYTWNRKLFPDPAAFIEQLHAMGLRTALNLHPAEGVHPHEEAYPDAARQMGVDPASGVPIAFDIADPAFTKIYFELLHHPLEESGVDFWWIDWQQGTQTSIRGLDPLWWLNHLHFHDLARNNDRRPFIFSRWGGLGNHRYPIGFSGDTVVSWESLAFQPSFTATAANVAYGWWSHDIGGHMGGIEDPELYTRWVQYGVLSPIFRLHCTNNPFHERRPWAYDAETCRVTREAMQFRHALIPYLYSMAWRQHRDAVALARPMYHDYPADERAYHCPDQYAFGSELIAAPHIRPAGTETRLSRSVVWLPPGDWYEFWSGQPYPGDSWHAIYGRLQDIPLFARAGAIVPLAAGTEWSETGSPAAIDIQIFPGADNCFSLYEDDGASAYSITQLYLTWTPTQASFRVDPVRGETRHLPARREVTLCFKNLVPDVEYSVQRNGLRCGATAEYDTESACLTLSGITHTPDDSLTVALSVQSGRLIADRDHRLPALRKLLWAARLNTWVKRAIAQESEQILSEPDRLGRYQLAYSSELAQTLAEIVTGAGLHHTTDPGGMGERIVLWNNNDLAAARYKLYAIDQGRRPVRQSGPLPRFAVLLAGERELTVYNDSQTQHYRSDQWALDVNLLDLTHIRTDCSAGSAWSYRILSHLKREND